MRSRTHVTDRNGVADSKRRWTGRYWISNTNSHHVIHILTKKRTVNFEVLCSKAPHIDEKLSWWHATRKKTLKKTTSHPPLSYYRLRVQLPIPPHGDLKDDACSARQLTDLCIPTTTSSKKPIFHHRPTDETTMNVFITEVNDHGRTTAIVCR